MSSRYSRQMKYPVENPLSLTSPVNHPLGDHLDPVLIGTPEWKPMAPSFLPRRIVSAESLHPRCKFRWSSILGPLLYYELSNGEWGLQVDRINPEL